MAVEECAEFQKALLKYLRYAEYATTDELKKLCDDVISEAADVQLTKDQVCMMFGSSGKWESKKLDRLAHMLAQNDAR